MTIQTRLIETVQNPKLTASKAARKVCRLTRAAREMIQLKLGLNTYDQGEPEDFIESNGQSFQTFLSLKNCPLWNQTALDLIRSSIPSNERENILRAAAQVRRHDFDLLGSEPCHVGTGKISDGYENIDWHLDFCHQTRWSGEVHHHFLKAVRNDGSDIKYVWELSRLQHLITLGQAYILTGDDSFAVEYKLQVLDWLAANPVAAGPNWLCCMDVAIRAANLSLSFFLFQGSKVLGDQFAGRLLVSLGRHCDFIVHHLECSGEQNGNHYLADLAELHVVCSLFPEFKQADQWLIFSQCELEREMQKQVHPDGTGFEDSTCYHRLVLELFFILRSWER